MVAIYKIGIKYNKNNEEEYNISITCYFLRYANYYNLKCIFIRLLQDKEMFVVRIKKYYAFIT